MAQAKCGFNSTPDGASGSDLLATFGPTLFVNIGFDTNYRPDVKRAPTPGVQKIQALVDTGAVESCIDNMLASQLRLPIINKRLISGVHGSHPTNMYLAQVHIPSLSFTIYGEFAGADLAGGSQIHRALIGRTFLRHFTMLYEGRTGDVILSN